MHVYVHNIYILRCIGIMVNRMVPYDFFRHPISHSSVFISLTSLN